MMLNFFKRHKKGNNHMTIPGDDAIKSVRTESDGLIWWQGITSFNQDLQTNDMGFALAMGASIPAYRCVRVISDSIAALPWQIINIRTNEIVSSSDTIDDGHILAKAIKSQYMKSGQPFFGLWAASLLVTGKNFIQPIPRIGDIDRPVLLRDYVSVEWLNPTAIDIDAPRGLIEGYWYNTPTGHHRLKKNEVVYDRYLNITDDIEGLSPMDVALANINIDRNAKRTLQSWYQNNCVPYAIISPKDSSMSSRQNNDFWDELKKRLRNQHQGSENQHRTMTLNIPVTVDTYDTPDLEKHTKLINAMRNEVYTAFGVPPAVAGDTANTPYKDAPETYEAFYTQALEPMVSRIEQSVNIALMPYFDRSKQFRFRFDTTTIDSLRVNEEKEIDNARKLYETGAITLQDYRVKSGAIEDGQKDVYEDMEAMVFVPALNAPIPLSELTSVWKSLLPQQGNIQPGILTDSYNDILADSYSKSNHNHDHDHADYIDALYDGDDLFPDDIVIDERIKSEMDKWVKFAKSSISKKNARRFEPVAIPLYYADVIEEHLDGCKTARDIAPAIYGILADDAIKTFATYRSNLQAAARRLWRGLINKSDFVNRVNKAIEVEFPQAYRAGLKRGGLSNNEVIAFMDKPSERKQMNDIITEERTHVAGLAEFIVENSKKDGGVLSSVRTRIELWTSKIPEIEEMGFIASQGTKRLKWVYDPSKENCKDCQMLNGRVYTASVWGKMKIHPRSRKLACFGSRCGCKLVETTDATTRGRPPKF